MNELTKLDILVQSPDIQNINLAIEIWKSLKQPRWEWHEQIRACMQWYKAQFQRIFDTIPEFIEYIIQNGLNFSFQSARLVPDAIKMLRFYTNDMLLMHSSLHHVPEYLKAFKQLKNLDISGNQIDRLPTWLWTFSQLELLDLQDTNLRSLNPNIEQLQALQILKLGGLIPIPLPPTLRNLPNLRQLYYGINAYPDDVLNRTYTVQFDIPSLYSLTIAGLKSFKIPFQFVNLSRLVLLAFHEVDILRCQSKLAQLPLLEHLILTSVSNIDMIWSDIIQCTQLDTLEINSCLFDAIPAQIQELKNLKTIRLARSIIQTQTMDYWKTTLAQWLPNVNITWI